MQTDSQTIVRLLSVDEEGDVAVVQVSVANGTDGPGQLDIKTEEGTVSEAHVGWVVTSTMPEPFQPGAGSPGPYATSLDRATVAFRFADGTQAMRVIASPKEAIFEADGETVDMSNALVLQWVATQLFYTVNRAGSPATEAIRGWRWKVEA